MADDCIFCAIAAGDAPAQVVDSDEHTLAFMDINPFTPGHALVIPRAHAADLTEISDQDLELTTVAAKRLTLKMQETLEPAGFNILNACGAAAWQTVFHFHLHVIPRYEDDPMRLPVIPRGGDMDEIARLAGRIRGED
jgi:histidine triad (HIT) family protein